MSDSRRRILGAPPSDVDAVARSEALESFGPFRGRLARRLFIAMLVPVVAGVSLYAVFAQQRAHALLEDELGRRLATAAVAVAVQILPEQVQALREGDEGSRTHTNVSHKLDLALARFDLRRVLLLGADFSGRVDTSKRLSLGARAHEVLADEPEMKRALEGVATASPLFTGKDGRPYKRAYAAVGAPGQAGGVVMVEGDATYYTPLQRFQRWLLLWGVGVLGLLLVVVVVVARRITGPVSRLSEAALRIGHGQFETPVPAETQDEIGWLAHRFEDMRRAVAARDERMQMMLAGIAHEVRNPLGGLALFTGLLREGLQDQPERLTEVARLERELSYLNAVVTDFLEYARRAAPVPEQVPLAPLFEELVEVAAPGDALVKIELVGQPAVQADRGQLRRLLLNLLRNALAAAPQGPVVLAARGTSPGCLIEVRDGGPGVPNELRSQIFTPFFTTREKGTGLGLALAREIVADHGGTLTLHDAPEGGACFRIRL